MADQDIRFTFLANVSDFIAKTSAASRALDDFGDEANVAGRKAEKAFEESQRGARAVKEAVDGLGLPFGRLIDNVTKLREVAARANGRTAKLLLTLGAVAAAGKVAAVAVAALSTALVGTALAAADLNDELQPLRDAGALRALGPEQARNIEAVRDNLESLRIVSRDLAVTMGTLLGPEVESVTAFLVGSVRIVTTWTRALSGAVSLLRSVGSVTSGLFPTIDLFNTIADAIGGTKGEAQRLAKELDAVTAATEEQGEAAGRSAQAVKGATFEYDKASEALSRLKIEAMEASAALQDVNTGTAGAGAVSGAAEAAALALRKELEAGGAKVDESDIFATDDIIGQAQFIGQQIAGVFDAVGGIADRVLADRVEEFQSTTDRIAEIDARLSGDISDNERKRLEARRDALEERRRAERQAALDAFNAQKGIAISQAVIGGALAIIQAFAQLGPIAGAVAAIAVGITNGIQIGLIASEQPKFHSGGMARDEVSAILREGEVAVPPQMVREAGGFQGVADRISGRGGDRVVPVVNMMGTRVLDSQARQAELQGSGVFMRLVGRGSMPGTHVPRGLRRH